MLKSKRVLIAASVVSLMLTTAPVRAAQSDVECPPFPISGKFSRSLQTVTGLNWVSGTIAGIVASHVIHRKLGGHVHVKVKPYSFTDLISGKIKSINIKADHCLVRAIPIGMIKVASANPLWYDPGWHGRKRGLRSPIMFNLNAHLNKEEVTTALNDPKVTSQIRGLKLDLPGLGAQQLEILEPKIELSEGVLQIDAFLVTQGSPRETGVPVSIFGHPAIVGPRVFIRDLKIESPDIPNPEEFAAFADELFNPIYDMGRADRKTHAFRVTAFDVKPDACDAVGTLVLAPKEDMALAQTVTKKRHWF